MRIRNKISCQRLRTQMCNRVQTPQRLMQAGTQRVMPYLRPRAAPTGCRATKNAKKNASDVLRSPGESPVSRVKPVSNERVSLRADNVLRSRVTRTSRLGVANIRLIKAVQQKEYAEKWQQNVVELANRASFQTLILIVAVEAK
jgi:hypothetical protein